ncbi:SapC family protein [Altererythrobacter sp. N1]|nr:SapC family protein [Altererythrobacter sp. N1]
MTQKTQAGQAAKAHSRPLFYKEPQLLHSQVHSQWRLKDGDAAFAAETPYVPILVGEFAAAARNYPIVFAGDDAQPLAVLGLETRNLFVKDGAWREDSYVPAYVRRYPFAFVATSDPDGFALAIDAGSQRVADGGEEGIPLFENGGPSDVTQKALEFCGAFQNDIAATRAFADALKAQDLLIDRRADATLPDGRKLGLDGFRVIDAETLSKLPDEIVLEWHNNGYLAWAYFHLASLDRFQSLLRLQADMSQSHPDASQSEHSDGAQKRANPKTKKVAS